MSDQIKFDDLFNAKSFDDGTKAIAQYIGLITEKIKEAKGEADKLTTTLGSQLKTDISQLSSESKNLSREMQDVANKMANFKQTTSDTKKVISDYEKENEKLRKELERLKVAQEGNTKASKASGTAFTTQLQSMIGLASGAAIVYKGITILTEQFKLALKSTMEFEQAMKEVQAISRASAQELALLTENANRLGATTEKTAGEIAKLQKELGKLGFNTTEILASTDAIVDLSTATGEDLASSATIAAATLRAFGLDAVEMGRVVDVMAGSFVRSGLDLEKFRESMKLVAPIAKATGIDIETVTASLSKLADAGLSGSLAGTALRNLFSSMADPTEKLTKLLGNLDGSLAKGVKSSSDFTRALVVLKESNIDLENAVKLVDVRARSAFFTLVDQAKVIEGLSEEYRDLNGEASKLAKTMRDTLTNDVAIMNSAFDATRRNIAELFVPIMRSAAQGTATFSEAVRFFVKDLSNLGNGLGENEKSILQWATGVTQAKFLFDGLARSFSEFVKQGRLDELRTGMANIGTTMNVVTTNAKKELLVYQTLIKNIAENKPLVGMSITLKNLGGDYEDLLKKLEGGADQEKIAGQLVARLEKNLNTAKSSLQVQANALVMTKKELEVLNEIQRTEGKLTKEQSQRASFLDLQRQFLQEIVDKNSNVLDKLEEQLEVNKLSEEFDTSKLGNLETTNKKLDEQIKLTYQLNEAKLKGELEAIEFAKQEASPLRQLELETEAGKKRMEIAKLKYEFELRQIEELYKNDKDYLLRRQVATQNFSNEIVKILNETQISTAKTADKLIKDSTKVTDEAIKLAKKAGFAALDELAKKRKEDQDQKDQDAKDDAKREKEKWDEITKIAQAAAQGLSRITTFAFDNRQVSRENELRAIDKWEQERLALAGDNEDAKKAIEEEAEKRRQKIKIQQAKDDKKEAMFQIILDTAVNIVKSFPNVLQMAFAGALGAAQLAVVANRPLPQFYKGTDDSPEGFAQVGERGRELVQDGKTKKWSLTPDKTTVAYLTKGSKVITNTETERVLAQDHNGRANEYLQSKVIVKDNNKINYKMIGQEVGKAVSTIPVNITNFDENGVTKYVMRRSTKITRLNKRY